MVRRPQGHGQEGSHRSAAESRASREGGDRAGHGCSAGMSAHMSAPPHSGLPDGGRGCRGWGMVARTTRPCAPMFASARARRNPRTHSSECAHSRAHVHTHERFHAQDGDLETLARLIEQGWSVGYACRPCGYAHTHVHAGRHACMHTCMHTYIDACMHTYVMHYTSHIHTCIHTCMRVCSRARVGGYYISRVCICIKHM